jgi:hypothetical protein
MDATERNNSRACALTIRTRGGFNGMVVYLTFHRMHYGYIPQMVLLQSFLLELLNMPFTCHSRGIHTQPNDDPRYRKSPKPARHVHSDILLGP